MKNSSDLFDQEIRKLMQDNREKAPENFADITMQQLKQPQRLPQRIFKPLLHWKACALFLSALTGIGWLLSRFDAPSSQHSLYDQWLPSVDKIPDFSFHFTFTDSWLFSIIILAALFLIGIDHILKRKLG